MTEGPLPEQREGSSQQEKPTKKVNQKTEAASAYDPQEPSVNRDEIARMHDEELLDALRVMTDVIGDPPMDLVSDFLPEALELPIDTDFDNFCARLDTLSAENWADLSHAERVTSAVYLLHARTIAPSYADIITDTLQGRLFASEQKKRVAVVFEELNSLTRNDLIIFPNRWESWALLGLAYGCDFFRQTTEDFGDVIKMQTLKDEKQPGLWVKHGRWALSCMSLAAHLLQRHCPDIQGTFLQGNWQFHMIAGLSALRFYRLLSLMPASEKINSAEVEGATTDAAMEGSSKLGSDRERTAAEEDDDGDIDLESDVDGDIDVESDIDVEEDGSEVETLSKPDSGNSGHVEDAGRSDGQETNPQKVEETQTELHAGAPGSRGSSFSTCHELAYYMLNQAYELRPNDWLVCSSLARCARKAGIASSVWLRYLQESVEQTSASLKDIRLGVEKGEQTDQPGENEKKKLKEHQKLVEEKEADLSTALYELHYARLKILCHTIASRLPLSSSLSGISPRTATYPSEPELSASSPLAPLKREDGDSLISTLYCLSAYSFDSEKTEDDFSVDQVESIVHQFFQRKQR